MTIYMCLHQVSKNRTIFPGKIYSCFALKGQHHLWAPRVVYHANRYCYVCVLTRPFFA